MPTYPFPSLPVGSIRLLRLMPHQDEDAPIRCRLFNYPLHDSDKGTHLYETLSYVWGSSDRPQSILLGDYDFPVTANLLAALKRLRDRFLERVVWVDAICINQKDVEERSRQVQAMAMIYAKSSRVLVWLGQAEPDGDHALEAIRAAAEERPAKPSVDKTNHEAILRLLQRPWFQRIWVREGSSPAGLGIYANNAIQRSFRRLPQLDIS